MLDIPAPKVLAWSNEADNSVGSEYIMTEEPAGIELSKVWRDAKLDDKIKIVESLVELEGKFLSLAFTRLVS